MTDRPAWSYEPEPWDENGAITEIALWEAERKLSGVCSFCGNEGHKFNDCPNRLVPYKTEPYDGKQHYG